MRALSVLIATFIPAAVCQAQTVLLPGALTATEGTGNATAPFGRGNQGARVQYIYDSAALVAAGLTAPIYLRTLAWRANGGISGQGGTFAAGSTTACCAITSRSGRWCWRPACGWVAPRPTTGV